MRLQLLIPRDGTHPFKERLHSWYSRLGYRAIGAEDIAKALPDIEKDRGAVRPRHLREGPLSAATVALEDTAPTSSGHLGQLHPARRPAARATAAGEVVVVRRER